MREGIPLDALNWFGRGYELHTTKSVGREGSKSWALSVVPHFSLSPPRVAFSRVGWFSRVLPFRSLFYPWGKMGDYSWSTRLKMAETCFNIFQVSCPWSNKWSPQIFMYWSIGCLNVLTNQSPFDRLVVALDVDGFPISHDALVWTLLSSRNTRLCFALLLLNGLLMVGIFVSASRRSSESNVSSPPPEADKTNFHVWDILQRSGVLYYGHWMWTRLQRIFETRSLKFTDIWRHKRLQT